MDIVVDTSVLVAVITNEPERWVLIQMTREADLIAPQSVHWEVGNAFSAMLRRRRVSLDQVLAALNSYAQIPIRFVDVELSASLELAAQWCLYAYDAYLLHCALQYRAPLLTLDRGLVDCARQMHIQVLEVTR